MQEVKKKATAASSPLFFELQMQLFSSILSFCISQQFLSSIFFLWSGLMSYHTSFWCSLPPCHSTSNTHKNIEKSREFFGITFGMCSHSFLWDGFIVLHPQFTPTETPIYLSLLLPHHTNHSWFNPFISFIVLYTFIHKENFERLFSRKFLRGMHEVIP